MFGTQTYKNCGPAYHGRILFTTPTKLYRNRGNTCPMWLFSVLVGFTGEFVVSALVHVKRHWFKQDSGEVESKLYR